MSDDGGPRRPSHLFTVDVEEYFQVEALSGTVAAEDWSQLPSRIERGTDLLLDVLERHRVRATFFVVGWLADRHPTVVRRIAERGHEVASHGWTHRPIHQLTEDEFREEARSSRELLQELTGQPVVGFRAPNFSLVPGTEWALEILAEEGYRFDSSVFPYGRSGSGYPGARARPHVVETRAGSILELPITALGWGNVHVCASGGAYFRHLPYPLIRMTLDRSAKRGEPAIFYIHPWELDPDQPRIPASWLTRLRHYGGLERTLPRLERLVDEFSFTCIRDHYEIHDRPALEV